MKRFLPVTFFFLSLIHFAGAQIDMNLQSHFIRDSSENVFVNLFSNYFAASNAVTNEMVTDYFFDRFITDSDKDGVSKNLENKNFLNSEYFGELSCTFRPDSVHREFQAYVALRSRNNIDMVFPKDAFELFFRGNKIYAGKTADISDTKIQYLSYWQFAFGLGNEYKKPNGRLYLAANVAVNAGVRFLTAESKQATIYTHPDGEYIDASLNAIIQTHDSATVNATSVDGFGISGDFYSEYITDQSITKLSVENIGYIQWNRWSTQLTIDSAFHFEGIEVKDLFNFSDSVKTHIAIDSTYYYNFVRHREMKRINMVLPYKISTSYSRYFLQKKLLAIIGADLLHSTHTAGRFAAAGNYMVHKSNQLGLMMAYNTDVGFQSGISYVHLFPKRLRFEIGSSYLFSMIDYYNGQRQGLYLSISKGF